jgi:hypothetical protein
VRRLLLVAAIALFCPRSAAAQETPPPAESTPADASLTQDRVHLDSDTSPPPAKILPEAPAEAPPPLPRHKGFVAEGNLGALGFFGNFRHVAPVAPWIHATFGYELLNFLMVFVEGELAQTDTSEAQGPSDVYAFAIFGFGGGLRATIHAGDRVALFVQGDLGALKADVPHGALADLGYKNAESLGLQFGGRLGFEWYQMDRHMALGLSAGARDATGFAKTIGSDTGLMADASATIRYTF